MIIHIIQIIKLLFQTDSNISRLPAPALHGTFSKAYSLLTRLANSLGWDELLRCRSQVFVMEEEYRMHKAKEENRKSIASPDEISQKLKDTSINEPKIPEPSVEKPIQVTDDELEEQEVTFSFGNKRLCERWLDNLFMVLYEDLRVYTFWRTEYAHYCAQKIAYRKTGAEWELLGDLGLRLWHEVTKKLVQSMLIKRLTYL